MISETNCLAWLLVIPIVLALAAFAARWLGAAGRAVAEMAHLLSVSGVLVASLVSVGAVLSNGPVFGLGRWLHLDPLGAVFLLIIGVVGFLVGLYSVGYTRHDLAAGDLDQERLTAYYGLFSLFLFSMLLVVTANNIIMMWVAVEATTLGSAFLVGIYGRPASLEAAWKYVIVCTVGVAFGLYGTILVYADTYTLLQTPGSAVLWTEIMQHTQALDPALIKMAFVFVLVGFGTKTGLFPMHAWLPDAHSEAPSPVSALLSAVLLNCALLVVLRFTAITDGALGAGFAQTLLVIFGAISVAAAALFMTVQRDLKRLLAYSSMENMGLVALAFGLGGPAGIFAGLLHAVNHSLVKALLFLTAGNLAVRYHTRRLERLQGLLQVMPASAVLLIVGALALVGVPPFNVFVSKFFIVTAGLGTPLTWLVVACLVPLTIVFAAFFRVLGGGLFGQRPEEVTRREVHWLMVVPSAALAALVIGLGLYLPPDLLRLMISVSGLTAAGDPTLPIASLPWLDWLAPLSQVRP
jgi:hydrogenase-4 component F